MTLNLIIGTVEIGTTQLDNITIQANATGVNYRWLNCDDNYSLLVGETNQTFTASINGNYAVEITENGCVDTSACVAITHIGLGENNFEPSILIYPNPSLGNFRIKLLDDGYVLSVTITNALGQEISTKSFSQLDEVEVVINGASGIYYVEVETTQGRKAQRRILKQ